MWKEEPVNDNVSIIKKSQFVVNQGQGNMAGLAGVASHSLTKSIIRKDDWNK